MKWSKLTPSQRDAGRRLAERAWMAGIMDVSVTQAAQDYRAVLARVEESERGEGS